MGVVMVGPKLTRRIARETGQNVGRAWGNGSNSFEFVNDRHEHGWWVRVPRSSRGEWGWLVDVVHMTSCHTEPWNEVFTGEPRPIEEREQPGDRPAEPPEPNDPIDLLAALERSVAAARARRKP